MDLAKAATGGAGPDVIYESVGGDVTKQCLELLAPRGQLVLHGALNVQAFALGVPELTGMIFKNQSLAGFALVPLLNQASLFAGLRELFEAVERGELKVTIGGRSLLEQAAEAHRALEARATQGKLLLVP